jgi:hypothetical protein
MTRPAPQTTEGRRRCGVERLRRQRAMLIGMANTRCARSPRAAGSSRSSGFLHFG